MEQEVTAFVQHLQALKRAGPLREPPTDAPVLIEEDEILQLQQEGVETMGCASNDVVAMETTSWPELLERCLPLTPADVVVLDEGSGDIDVSAWCRDKGYRVTNIPIHCNFRARRARDFAGYSLFNYDREAMSSPVKKNELTRPQSIWSNIAHSVREATEERVDHDVRAWKVARETQDAIIVCMPFTFMRAPAARSEVLRRAYSALQRGGQIFVGGISPDASLIDRLVDKVVGENTADMLAAEARDAIHAEEDELYDRPRTTRVPRYYHSGRSDARDVHADLAAVGFTVTKTMAVPGDEGFQQRLGEVWQDEEDTHCSVANIVTEVDRNPRPELLGTSLRFVATAQKSWQLLD